MNSEELRVIGNMIEERLRRSWAEYAPKCPHCGVVMVYEPARASHVASCSDERTFLEKLKDAKERTANSNLRFGPPERATGAHSASTEAS